MLCLTCVPENQGVNQAALFVSIEIENGYCDVSHIDNAVVVDVCVGFPTRRACSSIEYCNYVGNVSHVDRSIIYAWHCARNISWNSNMNRNNGNIVVVFCERFIGDQLSLGANSEITPSEGTCA